ncbi:MAG: ShlB/FhaC/HecB family hemolysin secretion/activation protein [Microcoleus sp. PH2017_25_DOB_D_A]|uniref:ShlB/FhaC/HecB family hemolysin secretion/activation protein n=1 Tax=unclassified Microcoleus TaxID=2642155 RepID=UPI001D858E31|nr:MULTISPECIES: ShlB/FhaC/HecB family hemolysin secretion/activation protein [unclassified Microcoleus]TAE09631.1 MAG: ShlB/FhaC/HecB family hemolysin secretion/activation protein [Oscillatoriales cyanobacterium]MCC3448898.1 ShlB/FhaC/HecB family hemolysin secretion/activation protein [Microcoleus sp. PH2017_09_SFU_O_A]MCC3536851.1 ShlB/FhaC/HecB family hemolysin secretion/activation protein [Microcoleus sp. PH2017_25_DOB_D_A]MCC3549014.1 ShlB/FhaC/HecB family hemolysin secretion/activation pr
MFNNRNRNRGDRWLPLSAGLLASSLAAWPLKAETLLLQPAGELNPGGPDLTVQVPNPAEPLEPQTTPSRQNPQNLPPTEPSPTLEERKTEPDSDTGEAYECSIPVPPADRSPATPTATPTPEDSKTDEAIEAISIANFRFVGNTVFSQETLDREITRQFLELDSTTNRFREGQITFAQLQQVISEVTKFYNQRGYINSFAYIPTTSEEPNQRLQNRGVPGEVIIKIVEGGLESIRVRRRTGRQRLNLDYVCSRLAIASQPLQVSRLLDALRLLELDPLIKKITAELIPGSQVHRSSLEVKFEEEQTFSVEVAIDNRRAPSVGTVRRQVQVNEANLLGRGDDLSLAYTNTDGSNAFDLSYTLPLNPNNGTIKVAAGTTANRVVEPPFEDVDLRAAARYLDITLRQPLLRTPRQEFAVGLTATRRESGTSILGEDFPLSPGADEKGRSRISALRFFQDWTVRSNEELLAFRSQFSLGLSAFNATVNSEAPDSRFLAWRGQAQWVRRLARDTFVFASSDLQLANRALLPLEQFGLGGFNSVRGYRQDLLLGDNGISASAELRFPIVGRSDRGLGVVQIAPFIDAGTVWNSSRREDFDPQTLVSVGAGLRWEMSDRLAASFYWGIPLVDVNSRQRTWQEKGLHFSVRSRFSF